MKPFSDIGEQLRILQEEKNLIVQDMDNTIFALMNGGYYEIVNGYKIFLLDSESEKEIFRKGETFEHLAALYNLDKDLRNYVMQATLEIESSLKTALAYTIAEDFGVYESDYLDRKKYNSGDFIKKYSSFQRDYLLDMLKDIANNRKVEPLTSYRKKHGHIPPWILFKEATFGNFVNLFKVLKGTQKNKVIAHCTNLDINLLTEADKRLFSEMLDLVLAFRNRAAHGGRIFNYKAKKDNSLSYHKKFHTQLEIQPVDYRHAKGRNDFYTFFYSMVIFNNKNGHGYLNACLYRIIDHEKEYPNDLEILEKQMGFPQGRLYNELEKIRQAINLYRLINDKN